MTIKVNYGRRKHDQPALFLVTMSLVNPTHKVVTVFNFTTRPITQISRVLTML